MTAKTSLFNKGIYKSVLRRFLWGSILYFIALFLTTSLPILMTDYTADNILQGYQLFPMMLAIGVPTVVGLMAYRFMHSKKASVFTHSLPVSRGANYISSVLASLTLMAVPVVLNTFILMLLSVVVPNAEYGIFQCVEWMANSLFTIFIMFSCTTFAASLTGNSFALVVLNVLLHTFLLLIAECTRFIAEEFICGFESRGGLIRAIEEGNFPARAFLNAFDEGATVMNYLIPLVAAVVLYVLALILYKKRHNETAEDIAGFKCLNHILKHFLTWLVALVTFSGFSATNVGYNSIMMWITIFILSAVTYFGAEMLLKKTFRVWGSYKGFLSCGAVVVIFIFLITKTSFFGYETRVPKAEDVEKISVCVAYGCIENDIKSEHAGIYDHFENCDLYFDNKDIIETGIAIHKELIAGRDADSDDRYNLVEIRYDLKGAKKLSRRYYMSEEELFGMMDKLYSYEEYKEAHEMFLRDDITVKSAYMYYEENANIYPVKEFAECMKKDIRALDYSKLKSRYSSVGIEVNFRVEFDDDESNDIQRWVQINRHYENTLKWLEENNYKVTFE